MADASVSERKSCRELRFSLGEEDFLTFHMYSSGHSENQKRGRRRNRIVMAVFFGAASALLFSTRDIVMGTVFAVLVVLWYLLYPFYTRWYHKRHFRRHIQENYKEKIGREGTVQLDDEGFRCIDVYEDERIKLSAVSELVELEGHFLIRFVQATSLILPRDRIGQPELGEFMREVSRRTGLQVKDDRKFKWS